MLFKVDLVVCLDGKSLEPMCCGLQKACMTASEFPDAEVFSCAPCAQCCSKLTGSCQLEWKHSVNFLLPSFGFFQFMKEISGSDHKSLILCVCRWSYFKSPVIVSGNFANFAHQTLTIPVPIFAQTAT